MKKIVIECGHAPVGSANYPVSLGEIIPGIAIGKMLAKTLGGELIAYFDDFNPGYLKAYDPQKLMTLIEPNIGPLYQSAFEQSALKIINHLKESEKQSIIELVKQGIALPVPLGKIKSIHYTNDGIFLDKVQLTCTSRKTDYHGQKNIVHKPLCSATSAAWLLHKLGYDITTLEKADESPISITVFPKTWLDVEKNAKHILDYLNILDPADISVFFEPEQNVNLQRMYETGSLDIDLDKLKFKPSLENIAQQIGFFNKK